MSLQALSLTGLLAHGAGTLLDPDEPGPAALCWCMAAAPSPTLGTKPSTSLLVHGACVRH
eukprot:361323-Chlamydomonas_euryale.AAC.5